MAVAFLLATNPLVAQAAGFITSADIVNNTIRSKDVKNETLKGKDVKDGKLTGADIADGSLTGGDLLVRASVASEPSGAVSGTTAETVALTTSITAPVRGYLLITAGSDVYDYDSDTSSGQCFIRVDGAFQAASNRQFEVNGAAGTNNEEDCSTNIGVAVNAGTHTVDFVADPGATTTTFDESSMEVLFVPFNGAGATPAKSAASDAGKVTSNR